MARLWDKGGDLDKSVHRFTVGDDPHWDLQLLHWDCLGSVAHARTLEKAGLLAPEEVTALINELRRIDDEAEAGSFLIPDDLEDCHTAIEARLTQAMGNVGEKIHTGRSRNDQVATAMRLFMRRKSLDWLGLLARFTQAILTRIDRDGDVAMPGYTHLQPAMPSSVGLWLHAFVEAALEQMRAALDLLDRLDCCPLGTGAGFGVPLPLDRQHSASLLGFSRVQRSPIDVQNSRGRMEQYFVRVAVDIGALLEKLSWDLALFSTSGFSFFSLPGAMTTGSSIMPQKKNPDVLELMRARAGRLRGRLHELEWIAGKLPSSYHRDLQLTKEPTLRAAADISEMLTIAERIVSGFTLQRENLKAAMAPELYATDAALALVREGVPFRQAYRQVAADIESGAFLTRGIPDSASHLRTISPSLLQILVEELADLTKSSVEFANGVEAAERALLALPPS